MNKKIIIPIIVFFFLVSNISAYFTDGHSYPTIVGLRTINSPITQMCKGREDIVLAGVISADVGVIHYIEGGKKIMSYIGTHTRGSYITCLEDAGADLDKRCFCIGAALHIVQDNTAHQELVPKYLEKYGCANLFCHMVIERAFDNIQNNIIDDNPNSLVTTFELQYWERGNPDDGLKYPPSMAPLFEDYKYVELLNEMTGIDIRNDIILFAGGLKGKGFDESVWGKKLELPWWFWGISIGLIILGFGLIFIDVRYGNTGWKWLGVVFHLIFVVLGLAILISFFAGKTWIWTDAIIKVPAGMISLSENEVQKYMDKVQEQTNYFLETGNLLFDDSSGLSYVSRTGEQITGALNKAEWKFKFVVLPILLFLIVLFNIWLYKRMFKE